jgi:hypothetical protein
MLPSTLPNIYCLDAPDERLGAFIVMVDVFADGLDEFLDVAEDAATQVVLSQVAEESLDHVQPHE